MGFLIKRKDKIDKTELYCWKGVLYYFLNDCVKASTCFEKAERIKPENLEIKYFLAETLYSLAEMEKAKTKYRALTSAPCFKNVGYYGIGCCLYKLKHYDEALSFFNKSLFYARGENIINTLNKKGLCLMAETRLQEAGECFAQCLAASSNNDFVKMNLALVLSKMGQYKEASDLYKAVLKKMPHNITTLNNLALCLASLGKYDEAIIYCNKGLEIDPLNVDLLGNKGYCLYKLNHYTNALEYLSEAEKIVKGDAVLLNNKVLCLIALEKYDEALKIINVLLEKDSSDDILLSKAHCLIKKGMYEDALDCLVKVQNKEKKRFDIYTLKGICFEKLGELGKAVDSFNKSLIIAG